MQKKRLSIEECDSLMATRSADASGAVWIHAYEEPFELTGFPWFAKDQVYRRLPVTPDHPITPAVDSLAWCTAGCKVRFRTNSSRILLRVKLQDNEIMDHMPRTGSNGFDLYTGAPGKEVYYYTTRANDAGYDFEIFRNHRRKCETITIHFPLYKGVDSLQIGVDNDAKVLPPEPYKEGYIAVYGTSITQGGCASRPGMASTSILSRMLKRHILNFGFSGSGKGEPEMAKILSELNPVMFWLDFQANAGDAYLENLENFIRILRETHPETLIVVLSRYRMSGFHDAGEERMLHYRPLQKQLIEQLQAAGDKNLYFIDGTDSLEPYGPAATVDGVHATDLGFQVQAEFLLPHFKKLLRKKA